MLFLDALGAEGGKEEFVSDRLYQILDRASRHCKPTMIISTNLNMQQLRDKFGPGNGERIVSRLRSLVRPLGVFPEVDLRMEKGEGKS